MFPVVESTRGSIAAALCIITRCLHDWCCVQQSQPESLWRRIQVQALRLFMRLFPWIHATQEGLRFGYQLLYLLDSTPFYTPVLHLLGQNIVRVSGQEMVSHEPSLVDTSYTVEALAAVLQMLPSSGLFQAWQCIANIQHTLMCNLLSSAKFHAD